MLDQNKHLLKVHVELMLGQVTKVLEGWQCYQNTKERVLQQMVKNGQLHIHPEEQEAILSDYEICVAIVSYYLGFLAGHHFIQELDGEDCIQKILKALTPLSDAE